MKKLLHITALTGIALLYCFVIGLYSGAVHAGDVSFSKLDGKATASYAHSVTAKSFQHTVQTENSITLCSHSNPIIVKDSYKEFLAANKAIEHVSGHIFSQYNFFSHKLLVRLQNTDIIFPFHYFW